MPWTQLRRAPKVPSGSRAAALIAACAIAFLPGCDIDRSGDAKQGQEKATPATSSEQHDDAALAPVGETGVPLQDPGAPKQDTILPALPGATADAITLGATCTSNGDCDGPSGEKCVDGVCCNNTCGNGDPNDCQACSIAAGASVNGTCETLTTARVCRGSAGSCDVAESCDGVLTTCPVDTFELPVVPCRPADGDCDVTEFCTGFSPSCPTNDFAPSSQACRTAVGDCDKTDFCSGSDKDCPTLDEVQPNTVTCRPVPGGAAGVCDVEEKCDGTTKTCPADAFKDNTNQCRNATLPCDVPENCSGSAADCPADDVAPTTTVCRPAPGVCDEAENCDGTLKTCPTDTFKPTTTQCRGPAVVCDAAEFCAG